MESLLEFLRNERVKWANLCTVTSIRPIINSSTTEIRSGSRGRPKISLDMDQGAILRGMHFKWNAIANLLGVSRATLHRKCKEAGYVDTFETEISAEDLQSIVCELKEQFPDAGERMLAGFIRAQGIHVTRERLRFAGALWKGALS